MDDDLIQTSQAGDIKTLYELIRNDTAALKRIDEMMFEDTPLHVAAEAGQTCFAMEVMNLMPSFSQKLNKDGLSPMHLALLKGHFELVLLLLRADRNLVRVKGRGGMTPLHYATQYGNIDILADFLAACPKSFEDMTVQSETVLHIAVKNNMIEALEVLVGWLNRVCHEDVYNWKTNITNWRDNQGNTVLDIAIFNMKIEAVQLLAEINAKNSKELTALRALQSETKMGRQVIRKMLRNTRVSKASSPRSIKNSLSNYLRSKMKFDERVAIYITRQRLKISEDRRNALLVVAGVIVAATFQAVFSPPGGFRQENDNPTIVINGTYVNTTESIRSPSKDAGKSVMNARAFIFFSTNNSILLCAMIGTIALLLLDGSLGVNLAIMLSCFLPCYGVSISVISPTMAIAFFDWLLFTLFNMFLISILVFYARGKEKIQQLRYNPHKCPKEAVGDEVEENDAKITINKST